MRLTLCVVVSAYLVAVGAHADITTSSACSPPVDRCEVPTKRLLGSHEPEQDDDEARGINDNMKTIASAIAELGRDQVNALMTARMPTAELTASLLEAEAKNFELLLKDWKPPAMRTAHDSKTTTERWDEYLERNGVPDEDHAFKLLGLYGAADKSVNSLLVSHNLERWHAYLLQFFANLNFEDTLLQVLLRYCNGNLYRAKLFRERLQILQDKAGLIELMWLQRKTSPADVFKKLKLDKRNGHFLEQNEMPRWIEYLDAYNDAYPKAKTTLVDAMHIPEDALLQMMVSAKTLPGSVRERVRDDLIGVWIKLRVDPETVSVRLGILSNFLESTAHERFHAWVKYLELHFKRKVSYDQALDFLMGKL